MRKLNKLVRCGLAMALGSALLFGCQGKDGEPGPKGDNGATGAQGLQGPQGDRASSRVKDGFITGTITGFRKDGVTPLNETFKYEFRPMYSNDYYSSIKETHMAGVYEFFFFRGDSLGTSNFSLRFQAPMNFSEVSVNSANIGFSKVLSDTQVLGVDGYFWQSYGTSPIITLSNVSYNASTGLVKGDYTWNATNAGYISSSGTSSGYTSTTGSTKPFKVQGSFSVPLLQVSSFRRAAGGR